MEHLPDNNDALDENRVEAALGYLAMGYRPIPLPPSSKGNGMRFRWKPYQTRPPTQHEVGEWFSAGESNVALVTGSGLVVVDVDAADQQYLSEIIEHIGDTPMKCRTPSGGTHLYFGMRKGVHYGNAVKANNRPIDLRCEGSFVVAPWSRTERGSYEWLGPVLPVSELPLLRVSWLRQRTRTRRRAIEVLHLPSAREPSQSHIRDPEAYCLHVESIMGQNGSRGLVRVVCVLRDAGRTPEQAFQFIMGTWNPRKAIPEWSEAEVRHAINRHYRLG